MTQRLRALFLYMGVNMSEKFAGLALGVDVSQVDNAVKSLQNFKRANDDGAKAVEEFAMQESMARAKAKALAEEIARQRKETEDARTNFRKLVQVIDPTAKKMDELREASIALDRAWQKGIVPDEQFFKLGEMLDNEAGKLKNVQLALTEEGRAVLAEAKEKERSALIGDKFIASLERQAQQAGKTKAEILAMQAVQMGRETQASPLIAQMQAQEAAAREAAAALKAEAAAKREAENQAKSFMSALKRQSEEVGLSRIEILELRAAEMGLSAQAKPMIDNLKKQAAAMNINGLSAGRYRMAMQQLPMQITDVVTSLASGMPVWLVAVQQGGQIKDSFGGIGNVMKLVRQQITLTRVAMSGLTGIIVGLGIASYQSYMNQRELQSALTLTGGFAAKSAAEIYAVTDSISKNSSATIGSINGIATSLAKSGKYTIGQIKEITKTTAEWSEVTGQKSEEVIEYFDKISKDPIKGLASLNEQFNFLEKGQLTYINNLRKTKGETAAVDAATKLFADTMDKRLKDMADSATPLEKMWTDIKKWASETWRDVGDHTVAALNKTISVVSAIINQIRSLLANGDAIIAQFMVKAGESYQNSWLGKIGPDMSGFIADQRKIWNDAKKDAADFAKAADKAYADAMKSEKQWIKEGRDRDVAAGKGYSSATKDAVAKEAEELAKKGAKARKEQVDAGAKLGEQYEAEVLALRAQLKVLQDHKGLDDKISQQRKTYWNDVARFQILEEAAGRRKLTTSEKQLLAQKSIILAASKEKAEIGDQIVQQERMNALLDKSVKHHNEMLSKRQALKATEGMSDRQASRYTEKEKIRTDWINGGGKETDSGYIQMRKDMEDYYAEEDALRASWSAGVSKAWANIYEDVSNVSGNVQAAFTNAFNGAADAMANFLLTGKLNFADFAKSILSDLTKMLIKMAMFNAMAAAFGGPTVSFSDIMAKGFAGGGYTGDGGKYEPKGVVHGGEFVFTKEATKRIGPDNLHKLMRGYANGGLVGASPISGSGTTSTTGSGGLSFQMGDVVLQGAGSSGPDAKAMEQGVRAIFNDMINAETRQGGRLYNLFNGGRK